MALEYRAKANGTVNPILTRCPICEFPFDGNGPIRAAHFRKHHTPEDFGL